MKNLLFKAVLCIGILFGIMAFNSCATIQGVQSEICDIKTNICENAKNICTSFEGLTSFDKACDLANSICEYSGYFCNIEFKDYAEAEKVKEELEEIQNAPYLYKANSIAILEMQKNQLAELKKHVE